jgi:hypothetical protein
LSGLRTTHKIGRYPNQSITQTELEKEAFEAYAEILISHVGARPEPTTQQKAPDMIEIMENASHELIF